VGTGHGGHDPLVEACAAPEPELTPETEPKDDWLPLLEALEVLLVVVPDEVVPELPELDECEAVVVADWPCARCTPIAPAPSEVARRAPAVQRRARRRGLWSVMGGSFR
jgi:hypothetical protein